MNHMKNSKANLIYSQSGVDIAKAHDFVNLLTPFANKTKREGTISDIGDFSGLFDISMLNYKNPILAATCDGVGSKVKLCCQFGQHRNIGFDLVAMCSGDLLTKGAEPLFLLNYFAVNKLEKKRDLEIIESISQACLMANCSLLGGETAQLVDIYQKGEYDISAFALGIIEKDKILPKADIKPGDIILGLPSSGLHANGFSLVRKILKQNNINDNNNVKLIQELLRPSKIYVNAILNTLKKFNDIKAIAHITGGGFYGNLPRILTRGLSAQLNLACFPYSDIFKWLQTELKFSDQEMLHIFNCGIGMALICKAKKAEIICEFLSTEKAQIIGKVIENNDIELIGKFYA